MLRRRSFAALVALCATLQLVRPTGAGSATPLSSLSAGSDIHKAAPATSSTRKEQAAFAQLVDDYFEAGFQAHPNAATEAGIHTYDDQMPDMSKQSIARRIVQLKQFRHRLQCVQEQHLDKTAQIDRLMLIADAEGELLELESIQKWRHDPDLYSSSISSDIFSLMKRNFAPAEQRLRSVIAREKAVPKMLAEARANLENPPKIYTEIALEQLPGVISFFENAVPQAFATVCDPKLSSDFQSANGETIQQLKDYQSHLRDQVLPKSTGSFAIGKENYRKKLLYNEMIDEPLDSLLDKGYNELHKLQKEFADTAHKLDPTKTAAEVYVSISSEHPRPDQLLSSVQNVLSALRARSQAVVDIPSEDELHVQETPPFMRATTFASMDAPGPFETKAKEAYYQVTLPEKGWDAKRVEEHMRFFCTRDLINTSVHEAYPGHFVQGLWVKQAPSKTRKLLGPGTYVEGWAHYCEQLMTEVGPPDPQMKLVQLHDALLRAGRYIVGIRMHTQGMTEPEAKDFFIKETYQEPANAEREAKRGTGDPTYLVYTLGKMQILALRDEYKKWKGDKFNLKQFHDEFLAQGNTPIKLVRKAMLPDTSE